ncbi:hypothetical protein ACOSQ3_031182 [Xanthoceras sorbifolium]
MAYLKKERFTSLKMEKSSPVKQSTRKWENLPVDIISKIFNGVPFSDLCDNLPFVCHSWRLGCWHTISPNLHALEGVDGSKKLMRLLKSIIWEGTDGYDTSLEQWKSSVRRIDIPDGVNISDEHLLYVAERRKVLDLSFINGALETIDSTTEKEYDYKNIKLMNLLASIMQRNDGYGLSIQNFFIHRDLEISDKHLVYIAERIVGVKRLTLLNCTMIKGKGFANAMHVWRKVNFIYLEKVQHQYVTQFIKEMIKSCSPLDMIYVCLNTYDNKCLMIRIIEVGALISHEYNLDSFFSIPLITEAIYVYDLSISIQQRQIK